MAERISIAHIFLTLNIGGMEKVGTDLIRALDAKRFKHHILCLEAVGDLGEALKRDGYNVDCLQKKDGFSFKTLSDLRAYFRANNIQIVHTNNSGPHFWGGLAACLNGIGARVHTNHGRNYGWSRRRIWLDKLSAFLSRKIICVSQSAADMLKEIDGVAEEKIAVIPNGIDTAYFAPSVAKSSLQSELGIDASARVVGSIARLSKDKDHKTLIEAVAQLTPEFPALRLLLVGDGPTRHDLEQQAIDLGVQDQVCFAGFRSDILDLLRLLDVYVLSTHTEGMSISLLEAMSTERAVIATAVGGNPEIVDDGKNGILVRHGDVLHLANALRKVLTDDIFAKQIAQQARDTVKNKYSIDSMAKSYEAIYDSVLSRT